MVKSRPHVILSAAMTLDGKIATKLGDSELSSRKDKVRVHKLRAKVDAILIGINTVKRDDPLLTIRYTKGKNPLRIVLDSNASISSKSRIIKTCSKIPTIIAVAKNVPRKNIARLQKYPIEIIISGNKHVNVKKLLEILKKKKIEKLLLEGGGNVNWEFVRQGLVDEAIVTVSPYLVGGEDAITLVEGKGFSLISKSAKLKLLKTNHFGNELVVHYATIF